MLDPTEAARQNTPEPTPAPPISVPTPPVPLALPTIEAPRARPIPQRPVQSVDQQRNDNQARPDDPAFLAQSNNNIREQTQAALRNLNHDDPSPQLGGAPTQSRSDTPGNSSQSVSADDRDQQGDRRAVPEPGQHPERTHHPPSRALAMNDRPVPSGSVARERGQAGAQGPTGTAGTPGQPAPAANPVTSGFNDAVATSTGGTDAIAQGPNGGTASQDPSAGAGGQAGRAGQGGQGGQGGNGAEAAARVGIRGMGARRAVESLTPTVALYDQVFGAEAARERTQAQLRRSQARGSYSESWRANRAAIENYVPAVRVGSQTALRTAASPFAAYLTAMHRRIHRLFADGFLADVESMPESSPLNDRSLVSTIEIILELDGRIHRLGIARTSGNLSFDVAALNSVRRAAPFGQAPTAIQSGDGRVYMHWAFYRSERQCGTFNAEPYILPHPAGSTPAGPTPAPTGPTPRDEHPPMPSAMLHRPIALRSARLDLRP